MSSTSIQQQFQYTQTTSKVMHFRNLPWECTDDELIDLCSPFGKVVNTKCNVGPNKNQAFVEFPAIGPDGKKKEPESNVLLATIENMQYVVTVDVLHT
ncbi:RNA-binding domain superfamily, partial [Sesbania bispinosa]